VPARRQLRLTRRVYLALRTPKPDGAS
jgi:hypothetical protein